MITVKEVAEMLNMTEHTVRFYTDKGLVPSIKRDKNNKRLFDDESINWLTGVKYLKESGMSIEAIKEYVNLCLEGESTIPQRYEIFLEQQRKAHVQLEEAKKRVQFMDQKAEHYYQILNKVIPDNMNPGEWRKESQIVASK
ncbi:MerR family transcriptional regulator [Terribacillus saccharophilus]|uniref:MerR family transcriptional regulator n=1 Tax=Terribacillus saccharophilus TaxID=361277 RepID=A0A268A9V5_9BACI|nr:MerR family transcriptional regulator [Terribacillus saccharophilus]PAD20898.1 MerR family transcriptional regulator [Terribacillus saccharophilus]PAF17565.1 MerR family transcriptional regulator [Terribacillus saccharophilus]PAF22333.1 MerR family transcriptional regulator [Terribacillus saccharophilus]PAF34282.1 MerR family transcriptional regulator [Terribacillus saccharophilus]PAF38523.1 MerR family transcriptional regulator [Terribacillus saccharophilus]